MAAETGENSTGSNLPKSYSLKDNMSKKKVIHTWLIRELKDWSWQLWNNKEVVLINKKKNITFYLDKVRLMSFMKFAISALDKMRIEEGKQSRAKAKMAKIKTRGKVQQLRLRIRKNKKKKTLIARARIK